MEETTATNSTPNFACLPKEHHERLVRATAVVCMEGTFMQVWRSLSAEERIALSELFLTSMHTPESAEACGAVQRFLAEHVPKWKTLQENETRLSWKHGKRGTVRYNTVSSSCFVSTPLQPIPHLPMSPEEHITMLLDKVRPYVVMHGGDVQFLRIEGNTAYCKIYGACTHCMLSEVTYTKTIGPLIVQEVAGIEEVVFE